MKDESERYHDINWWDGSVGDPPIKKKEFSEFEKLKQVAILLNVIEEIQSIVNQCKRLMEETKDVPIQGA